MPYRHAHYWIGALVPLIVLAFWPGYFSTLGTSSFALHAHGITATCWIAFVAFQSWSIGTRRPALHRVAGLALFAIVPLFAAGGVLAIQSVARKFVTAADPFSATFGARLAPLDLLSVITMPALVVTGVTARRRVRTHAAAMLATVLLVLPPILGRLMPLVPGFLGAIPAGVHPFEPSFHAAQVVAIVIALVLYRRDPRHGMPFAVVAALIALESVLFATLARTSGWTAAARALAALPPAPIALAAFTAAAAALWLAWSRPKRIATPAFAT